MHKIVCSKSLVDNIGGWSAVVKRGNYSIKQMYLAMQGSSVSVGWKRLIYDCKASPRSIFILWLALHKRLATVDRLCRWGIVVSPVCALCNFADESIQHLFLFI